jgi:HlyD family secretion protein
MKTDSLCKHSHPLLWILAVAAVTTTVVSAGAVYQVLPLRWSSQATPESKATTPPISKVAALGRLEP